MSSTTAQQRAARAQRTIAKIDHAMRQGRAVTIKIDDNVTEYPSGNARFVPMRLMGRVRAAIGAGHKVEIDGLDHDE